MTEKKKPGRKPYDDRGEISVPVTFWTKEKNITRVGGIQQVQAMCKYLFESSQAVQEGGSK